MIISSDCIGAIIYNKILNIEYPNQFMNIIIDGEDFNYLVKNIENINFTKFNIFSINVPNFENTSNNTIGINIDNKIKLLFVHHNNIDHITQTYINRTNRFLESKDKDITFILDERIFNEEYNCKYLKETLIDFCNINTKYKRILITQYDDLKKYENDNLKICIKNKKYLEGATMSFTQNIFYEQYKDFISI